MFLAAIQGNVEAADKIEIRKEARLVGDIKTARIVIEDGAYFKGSIDIARGDAKAATAERQGKARRCRAGSPQMQLDPQAAAAAKRK